jgi:hypothetical protein
MSTPMTRCTAPLATLGAATLLAGAPNRMVGAPAARHARPAASSVAEVDPLARDVLVAKLQDADDHYGSVVVPALLTDKSWQRVVSSNCTTAG